MAQTRTKKSRIGLRARWGRTCAIVLVGADTANRKWINYEIVKAWNDGLGVVGINIHGLKNCDEFTCAQGANPFDFITHGPTKKPLSSIVKCYNPSGAKLRRGRRSENCPRPRKLSSGQHRTANGIAFTLWL